MSNNEIDLVKELNANFKDLKLSLLSIKHVLKDLSKDLKDFGKESGEQSSKLENFSKGIKGVGGAFTVAKHSLALFGIESKSLKEVESKIKSMIEVVGGLQTAFKTLGKNGTIITVLIGLVVGLVDWYQKWITKQDAILDAQSKFNDEVEKSYSGLGNKISTLKNLQDEWSKLDGNLDAQKKFIEANQKEFSSLGIAVNSVNDANQLLIESTPEIIEALNLQAQAAAARNLANKEYEEQAKLLKKAKDTEKKGPSSLDYFYSLMEYVNAAAGPKIYKIERNTAEDYKNDRVSDYNKKAREKEKDGDDYRDLERLKNEEALEKLGKAGLKKTGNNSNNENSNKSTLLQDLKNYKNEILKTEEDIQRTKTGLMEEGTEKEIQSIKDQYERKIDEINKQEDKLAELLAKHNLSVPEEDKAKFQEQRDLAEKQKNNDTKAVEDNQAKKEEESLNALLQKYQDYADQRKAIEEKFTKDIDALKKEREKAEKEGNTEKVKLYDGKIAQATQNKGKELMTHDFNALKENPDFTWAFDNIKSTSTETLNVLLEQLNAIKDSNKEIDATKLKEYSGAIQQLIDELATRNPVAALANAQNQLTQANTRLAKAKQELDKANESGDDDAKAKATAEHTAALIEVDKANKDVTKSQKVVNEKMGELFKNLSGVGEAIGGQAGQIISLIGDIGSFVTTSISGIEKAGQAGAGALAAVEKASAILAIIQLVIQLMSKIGSIMSDTHQQYEKYAKKLAEINKLRDAVNEYELAVLKAKQAEDNWFGGDDLQSLKNAKEVNTEVKKAYDEKVNEKQAKYENEKGGGWLTNTTKWLGDAYQNTFGKVYDITVGKPSEFLLGKTGKFIAKTGEAGSFGLGTQASLGKYKENEVSAIDNLRIETRKAKKGFLGSGVGSKSQKTEDLRTWARNNGLGELFDEDNMINKEAAQTILDKYGDKLVGETKETLEALVDLREQYEEYQQQLKDYVSSLYEPLVGNFVDSLWDWFDEGKDALTSFKEMASGTFRDIVSDMMKTIVLEKVVGSYSDDIVDMYNEYAEGKLTEEQLMDKVAQRTDEMIGTYEEQIPALQNLMTTLGDSLNEAGIDIQKKQEAKEQTAEKGSFQTMSQETGSELLGQFTAIRIHTSNIYGLMDGMEKEGKLINNSLTAIEKNTFNTVSELKEVNNKLKQIKVEGIKVL